MGCASSQPTSHTKQPLKQQLGKGSNIKPIPKVERLPQYVAPNDSDQFNNQKDKKNKNSNIEAESQINKKNQKINESLAQIKKSKQLQRSKFKNDENQIQTSELLKKQQKKDKTSQVRQNQQNSHIKEVKNSQISNKQYSQIENTLKKQHQSEVKQQVTEINKDINNISGQKASSKLNQQIIYNQAGQISKIGYQSGVKKQSQLKLSKKFEQQVQPAKLGYQENKEIINSNIQKQNQKFLKDKVQQIPTIKKSQIKFQIRQTTSPYNNVTSSSPLENAVKNKSNTLGNSSSQRVTVNNKISHMGSNHVHSDVVDESIQKGSNIQNRQVNKQTSQINENSYQNSYDFKKSKRKQSEQPNDIDFQKIQVNVHEAPNKSSLISEVNDESLVISKEHNFDLGIQFNPQMLTIDMNRIGW